MRRGSDELHTCTYSCIQLVAPSDIAIYGTLCALATLSRSTVKSSTLVHTVFATYIEQEPYVRDLVQAYLSSDFKTVLELLARYSVRTLCCIHSAIHRCCRFNRLTRLCIDSFRRTPLRTASRPGTTSISTSLHMYPS